MNKNILDLIITTDSKILYYGSKGKFERQDWVEITEPVLAKDLDNPVEAETLNSMLYLSRRKHKTFLIDDAFFKKFKEVDR